MMLFSLRTRLFLTCLAVVAVAAGTVALLASRVSASELQRFVDRDMERNRTLIDTVLASSDSARGLGDAPALAARLAGELGERVVVVDAAGAVVGDSAGALLGSVLACGDPPDAVVVTVGRRACPVAGPELQAIALGDVEPVERQANIIFYSAAIGDVELFGSQTSHAARARPAGEAALFGGQTRMVAADGISITRPGRSDSDPVMAGYLSAVNQAVLLAALLAVAVALALTLALSRSVLRPVEVLTAAARRVARGEPVQPVAVRARGELGTLAGAFNAMAEGLARQEELRRHLVSDVAHELRTPLTNIRGYLEAARDGVVAMDGAMVESLHEEALLLNRLVDDLQELALAEAGQLRLERRPTPADSIVERAAAAALPRAVAKGLRLEPCVAPGLPPLDVDPERVGQVLRNLLSNAITHTPPGGSIRLQAAALPAADGAAPLVLLSVRDTGVGIAADHLPLVFERFFRADSSRARSSGGAGLGLAIVRQLVAAHGGRVWAESAPGAGAAFHVALPAAKAITP